MERKKQLKTEKMKFKIEGVSNKPKKLKFNVEVAKERKEKNKNKSNKSNTPIKVDSWGRDISSVALRIERDKERVLKELGKTFGIVTNAIAKVGIDNSTFYKWFKEDSDFAQKVEEVQNGFDVIVEDKLKQKIIQNDGHSIRFYLSHRVKKYRPNVGIGQADDLEPVKFIIEKYQDGDEKDND